MIHTSEYRRSTRGVSPKDASMEEKCRSQSSSFSPILCWDEHNEEHIIRHCIVGTQDRQLAQRHQSQLRPCNQKWLNLQVHIIFQQVLPEPAQQRPERHRHCLSFRATISPDRKIIYLQKCVLNVCYVVMCSMHVCCDVVVVYVVVYAYMYMCMLSCDAYMHQCCHEYMNVSVCLNVRVHV